MPAADNTVLIPPTRVHDLLRREQETFAERTRESSRRHREAVRVLAGGVASSFQHHEPWPIHLERGQGPAVWDVDGHRRVDFHNGFGAMLQGHAHPVIAEALAEAYARGSQLGAPSGDAVAVAQELRKRWSLPLWRFTSSGSEATMDAIRIARAFTGREVVVKMFGAYHGHHDAVLVSTGNDAGDHPAWQLPSVAAGRGIPDTVVGLTVAVPFNDAEALDARLARLAETGTPAACVIVEPAFQMGVLLPADGYLAALREVTRRHGALLVFDEVKSGFGVGPAGVTGRSGVIPDLVTLGKALGAGLPLAAVGGSDEVMALVRDRAVYQVGTFNGNALAMAVALVNLREVLTVEAHARLDVLGTRLVESCLEVARGAGLPAHGASLGARGFVALTGTPARDHASVATAHPPGVSELAWYYLLNRGQYVTPVRPLQTMLTLAHGEAEVDGYCAAFAALVDDLAR